VTNGLQADRIFGKPRSVEGTNQFVEEIVDLYPFPGAPLTAHAKGSNIHVSTSFEGWAGFFPGCTMLSWRNGLGHRRLQTMRGHLRLASERFPTAAVPAAALRGSFRNRPRFPLNDGSTKNATQKSDRETRSRCPNALNGLRRECCVSRTKRRAALIPPEKAFGDWFRLVCSAWFYRF
jgi:hypothetical protein